MELIAPMREKAMAMFKDSVDAYVREDVELARSIGPCDHATGRTESRGKSQIDRSEWPRTETNCAGI